MKTVRMGAPCQMASGINSNSCTNDADLRRGKGPGVPLQIITVGSSPRWRQSKNKRSDKVEETMPGPCSAPGLLPTTDKRLYLVEG